MKKISNKKLLNIITYCVLLIVPFLKFLSINLEKFGLLKYYDSINPAIPLYVAAPFLLFIYIKDIIKERRKLDIYDYIFLGLCISGIISIVFSIDKYIAIFGKEYRHEGFWPLLTYYLIFINYKVNGNKEDIKKFLKLVVIIGIINSVYALLQVYTKFSFILNAGASHHMAAGLCGNPNFLGSLIVTCMGIMISKILMENKIKILDIVISILLFTALINCQSTGPFLAFIVTIIFMIIFLAKKKKLVLKSMIVIAIVLTGTYISIYSINKYALKSKTCEMCVSSVKKTISSGGTNRLEIWENSLGILKSKKRLIVGVGPDNFYLAYPNPKPEGKALSLTSILYPSTTEVKKVIEITDNAHNVYLHTLVTTGILGLIPYLCLCLFTFLKALKSKDKLMFILLGGFVAYSTQAFANINVVQITPIYYLIIGLILSIKE